MGWVKVDDRIFTNRKIVNAGKDGTLLYLAGLAYSASELTDGHLTAAEARTIAGQVNVPAKSTIDKLVAVGLWQQTDTGYLTPDYLDYNPSGAEERARREKDRERKRKARARGAAKSGRDANGRFTVPDTPDVRTDVHPDGAPDSHRPSAECPPLPVPPLTSSSSSTPLSARTRPVDEATGEEEPSVIEETWRRLARHDLERRDAPKPVTDAAKWLDRAARTRRDRHHDDAVAWLAANPHGTPDQLAHHLEPACGPNDGGAGYWAGVEAATQAYLARYDPPTTNGSAP